MAKYTQTQLKELKTVQKGGRNKGRLVHRAWKGVLRYREDNPAYVEDTREASQRLEFIDRKTELHNPNYIEDVRTPQQRRRYVWREVAKTFDPETVRTRTEALGALEDWRAEMEKAAQAGTQTATLGDYIEGYIEERLEAQNGIEKSTARDYRHSARRLTDSLRDTPLGELTADQVSDWEKAEAKRGISASTILKAHRLLWQVCEHARKKRVIGENPIDLVDTPKRDRPTPNALDEDGVRRLTGLLTMMDASPLATAAFLALHAGLRQGECCGLRWRDVDLDGKAIHITEAIGVGDGGAYTKRPKTKRSRRDIPIDDDLVEKLRNRRDQMRAELAGVSVAMGAQEFANLYVCGTIDGRYYHPTKLSREWAGLSGNFNLVGTQGRKVVFHDLRHSYVTSAIRAGMDVVNVAANAGHSSTQMTLDVYGSPTEKGQRAVADAVGDAMRPVPSSPTDVAEDSATGRPTSA